MELAFNAADDLFAETQVLRGYTEGTWETKNETGASEEARQRLARGVRYGARVGDGRWSAEWEVPLEPPDLAGRRHPFQPHGEAGERPAVDHVEADQGAEL